MFEPGGVKNRRAKTKSLTIKFKRRTNRVSVKRTDRGERHGGTKDPHSTQGL
jgi:hypothetical protein